MHFPRTLFSVVLSLSTSTVEAQAPPVSQQSTGFNSSFALSPSQIASANLSAELAARINTIVNFDRSQLANGGPAEDSFYSLPPLTNTSSLKPGTILKVQEFTNTTSFVLPPNTALSRILYTTTNHNGTVIPASAFILWPFAPKTFPQAQPQNQNQNNHAKAPTILWAHGTSGFFASRSPSSHRALWYGDAAPFALALAGYAVVAPDYAGLGISTSWDGSDIPHQYLLSSASAHDALHALQASLAAFPGRLEERFVAMGHSQGGGVAWSVAEVLAADEETGVFADLAAGYLGAIAGSPTTRVFPSSSIAALIAPWVSLALPSLFPSSFEPGMWLTPLGIARTRLLREIEGGISVSMQLFEEGEGARVVREDYYESTWHAEAYERIADAGGKRFKGPLVVLQGTEDPYIPVEGTTRVVRETCAVSGNSGVDLEYVLVNGTTHVPTLYATRQVWLQWIEDRFAGRPLRKPGCGGATEIKSWLELDRYQEVGNSFPMWAGAEEFTYQTPLGP